jgi:hypothetical protein
MLVLSARHVAAAIVIATSAVATPLAAASPKAGTVFYSGTGNAGYDEAYPYAEQDLKTGEWTGTPKCSTGNAASAVTGKPNTLAGWSLGRHSPPLDSPGSSGALQRGSRPPQGPPRSTPP